MQQAGSRPPAPPAYQLTNADERVVSHTTAATLPRIVDGDGWDVLFNEWTTSKLTPSDDLSIKRPLLSEKSKKRERRTVQTPLAPVKPDSQQPAAAAAATSAAKGEDGRRYHQARGSAAYQLGALLLLWTLYTHASNVRALVLGAADAVAAALALRPHLAGYAAAAAALLRICAALAYLAAGWALAAFVLPHALTRFRLPEVELEYARTVNSGSAALDGWAATACAALQLPAALSAFPNPLPTVGALLALAPAAVQWRCGHAAYAALREWLLLRMQLVLLALHVIGVASGDRTTGADIAFLVLPAVALSLACRVGAAVPIHLVALATYVLITTDGAAAGGGGGSSRGAGGAEAAAAAARSSDIAAESTAVFVATTLAWACDAARRFTFRAARLRSSSAAVTAADSDDLCAR